MKKIIEALLDFIAFCIVGPVSVFVLGIVFNKEYMVVNLVLSLFGFFFLSGLYIYSFTLKYVQRPELTRKLLGLKAK